MEERNREEDEREKGWGKRGRQRGERKQKTEAGSKIWSRRVKQEAKDGGREKGA